MNVRNYLLLSLALWTFGCSTINIHSVREHQQQSFNPLQLSPAFEHNSLRIDVIRQVTLTYDYYGYYYDEYDYGYIEEEDVPYHPMGFDLGNGLFYDMSGNFSLRIDNLLDFDPEREFTINKLIRPSRRGNSEQFSFVNNSLAITKPSRTRGNFQYRISEQNDTLIYSRKGKRRYATTKSQEGITYQFKNRRPERISSNRKGGFVYKKRNREQPIRLFDDRIWIGNQYVVWQSEDRKFIFVNSEKRHRKNKRPLLTIKKSDKLLLAYDQNRKGIRVELGQNSIYVEGTGLKPTQYSLIEGIPVISYYQGLNE